MSPISVMSEQRVEGQQIQQLMTKYASKIENS
jgi:hypothetical protein